MKNVNFELERECSICGMDEWCGTDGCPLDPQQIINFKCCAIEILKKGYWFRKKQKTFDTQSLRLLVNKAAIRRDKLLIII